MSASNIESAITTCTIQVDGKPVLLVRREICQLKFAPTRAMPRHLEIEAWDLNGVARLTVSMQTKGCRSICYGTVMLDHYRTYLQINKGVCFLSVGDFCVSLSDKEAAEVEASLGMLLALHRTDPKPA